MDVLASPVVVSTLPPLAVPAAPLAAAPDALATARFSALMQAPPATVTPAAQAAAAAASNPAEPHSVGDRILAGMQSVSGEFQSAWKSVSASLDANTETMGMQDLLKLQMHLVQVSVQYDLVGKAVSRSTQNFDQLVRVQ